MPALCTAGMSAEQCCTRVFVGVLNLACGPSVFGFKFLHYTVGTTPVSPYMFLA